MPHRSPSPKFIGERAECAFMKAAMDRGLVVSKPFGDSAGYDIIVDTSRPYDLKGKRRGSLWRVQVKCASRLTNSNEFQFHGWRSSTRLRQTITARDTDFLACYVIPYDTWYIIPVRALTSQAVYLRPHIPHSRGRFERYRERWDLLGARPPLKQARRCPERPQGGGASHRGIPKARTQLPWPSGGDGKDPKIVRKAAVFH